MGMTNTETTTRYESFLDAARRGTVNAKGFPWYTPEAIALRATEQGSCVWHAATSISLEHLDELGYGTCRYCGGVTAPSQGGVHALCVARSDRGRETPTLDSSPRCQCATCLPGVRRMV